MSDQGKQQGGDEYIFMGGANEPVTKAFAKLLGVEAVKIEAANGDDKPETYSRGSSFAAYPIGDQDLAQGLVEKINSAFAANKIKTGQDALELYAKNGKIILEFHDNGTTKKYLQEYLDIYSQVDAAYGDEIKLHRKLAESLATKVQGKESLAAFLGNSEYNFKIDGKDTRPSAQQYQNGEFTSIPENVKQAALKNARELIQVMRDNGKSPENFKELIPYSKIDDNGSRLSEQELAAALIAGAMLTERDNLQPEKAPITSKIKDSASFKSLGLDKDIVENTYTAFTVAQDIFEIGVGTTPETFSKAISKSKGANSK